jgi:hypothetical protein
MKTFRDALRLVCEFRRSYVALNLAYYGLVAAAMVYVAIDRDVQKAMIEQVKADIRGPLAPVARAYETGVLPAVAMTFAVNLLIGSAAMIALPSLVIPFSGILVGATRAFMWGLIFSPMPGDLSAARIAKGILIGVLLLLEGQGFILAMFASYVQGTSFLFPARVGAEGRWHGYKLGLKHFLRLYVLVAAALAIAAMYEAVIAILILPRLA